MWLQLSYEPTVLEPKAGAHESLVNFIHTQKGPFSYGILKCEVMLLQSKLFQNNVSQDLAKMLIL